MPFQSKALDIWGSGTTPAITASDLDGQPKRVIPMIWVQLVVAGLLEVVWAYSMKQSDGFSRPGYSAVTIVAMIASFWLLARAMTVLPLGTAYVIWTGIGSVGAFILGLVLLGETASPARIGAAVMIVGGILLMKATSS
ncbi:DMT family transporter [Paracoccus sediminicola]|uniref:DMT family transporter n=1 Tax=Paracoccus sediminicola TaxID=3017783 RepID=UPI003EB9A85F